MLTLDANVQQRLYALSCKVGQAPELVLEQALDDYERKWLSQGKHSMEPRASAEAELLDDLGRIRVPPRAPRQMLAQIVSTRPKATLPHHRSRLD